MLVSADSHINEPPELWNALSRYGNRAPHVVKNAGTSGLPGDWFLAEELRSFPLSMNNVGAYPKADRPARLRDFDFARDASPAAYKPDERLKVMDTDGVKIEVIYPSYSMRLPCMRDPELQDVSLRLSNEWLAQFCRAAPQRFVGVSALSLTHVGRAIEEMQWGLSQGLKGVSILATPPAELPYSSMHYERFWAAAAEAGVPVSLHALPPLETAHLSNRRKPTVVENRTMALIEDFHLPNILYDHSIQLCLTQLVLSGVLERHPKLKLVFAEWGTAWISMFMGNLDYTYNLRREALPLKMPPSEYMLRQTWWTFDQGLQLAPAQIERMQDRLMWASDYPHIESSFPESQKTFAESTSGLSGTLTKKLGYDNCARLYGLEVK